MRRYGHTITCQIADAVERAYMDGARAGLKAAGTPHPPVAVLKELSAQAQKRGDDMHDGLATPRGGSDA